MSLSEGVKLGPYQIVDKLGEGGLASAERSLRSQLRRVRRSPERTAS